LDQACFRPGIAYSLAEMRLFLSDPRSITLVAEDDGGRLAGFAIVEDSGAPKRRRGHIITIDVSLPFRRQGVGRLLMENVEASLAERGVRLIRLEVSAEDEGAQQFYARLGYEAKGLIPGYYLNKLDALVMEKNL
jgi:ribosomal-protein-alanine N-acetyltransferase